MKKHFWGDFTQSSFPVLKENLTTQYLIVGAGISGLSAAYFLLEQGIKDIVIIEKGTVGSGSTGHSAGMLVCEAEGGSWPMIAKYHGIDNARLYRQAQIDALNLVAKVIDVARIHCEPIPEELILIAHDTRSKQSLLRDYATRKAMSQKVAMLQGQAFRDELNAKSFFLGTRIPENLSVNPLVLARGFAQYLKQRGVKIYEKTPYLGDNQGVAKTPDGTITFNTVIMCLGTNERSKHIDNYLTTIAVTRSLTKKELLAIGLADRDMFLDNQRRSFHYGKMTADNRLLIGYGDILAHRFKNKPDYLHKPHLRSIQRFLKKAFPQVDMVIDHAWSAPYALNRGLLPHVSITRQKISLNGAGTQLVSIATASYAVHTHLSKSHPLKNLFQ